MREEECCHSQAVKGRRMEMRRKHEKTMSIQYLLSLEARRGSQGIGAKMRVVRRGKTYSLCAP
jgi:hypothetical protein